MNDERLRQLYMQGLAERETRSSRGAAPCAVSPDELLALARGELEEDRRLELLDQVMVNARCRQELDLLRAVVAAEREALAAASGVGSGGEGEGNAFGGAPTPAPVAAPALRVIRGGAPPSPPPATVAEGAPRRAWWRHGGLTAGVAASLLLAVSVGQFLRAGRGGSRDELTRGAGDGVAVVTPEETVDAGVPVTFAWHPVAGATRYALDLSDAGGSAVWETTTRDTTLALPAAVVLRAGVDYRWIVRALDDAGTTRATTVRRLAVRGR